MKIRVVSVVVLHVAMIARSTRFCKANVNLEQGQNILVQVLVRHSQNKGVRVTSRISLLARFLCLCRSNLELAFSRKVIRYVSVPFTPHRSLTQAA